MPLTAYFERGNPDMELMAGTPGDGPHAASTLPFEPTYTEYVTAGMPSGAAFPAESP
jgi:hypothetical protein